MLSHPVTPPLTVRCQQPDAAAPLARLERLGRSSLAQHAAVVHVEIGDGTQQSAFARARGAAEHQAFASGEPQIDRSHAVHA